MSILEARTNTDKGASSEDAAEPCHPRAAASLSGPNVSPATQPMPVYMPLPAMVSKGGVLKTIAAAHTSQAPLATTLRMQDCLVSSQGEPVAIATVASLHQPVADSLLRAAWAAARVPTKKCRLGWPRPGNSKNPNTHGSTEFGTRSPARSLRRTHHRGGLPQLNPKKKHTRERRYDHDYMHMCVELRDDEGVQAFTPTHRRTDTSAHLHAPTPTPNAAL